MKTFFKFIGVYFGIQILVVVVCVIGAGIYQLTQGREFVYGMEDTILWATLLAFAAIALFLCWRGYVDKDRKTWSMEFPVISLLCAVGFAFSGLAMQDALHMYVTLPNWFEATFTQMMGTWVGFLAIVIVGPVMEELLFRGWIMRVLLERTTPTKAIIYSALIFGLIHMNPVQILYAGLIGLVLGWLYYKTGSLIPSIVMHIVANGTSFVLSIMFTEQENFLEVTGTTGYIVLLMCALAIFTLCLLTMRRLKTTPWQPKAVAVTSETEQEVVGA